MKTTKWFTHWIPALAVLILGLGSTMPGMVEAAELWVIPGEQVINSQVGNWGTAKLRALPNDKETHFTFHVPANYDDTAEQPDGRLLVVVIPPETTTLDYTANMNVARDGYPHTMNPARVSMTMPVVQDALTEVDRG